MFALRSRDFVERFDVEDCSSECLFAKVIKEMYTPSSGWKSGVDFSKTARTARKMNVDETPTMGSRLFSGNFHRGWHDSRCWFAILISADTEERDRVMETHTREEYHYVNK